MGAAIVFPVALFEAATRGPWWPWFSVAVWALLFVAERVMHRASERERDDWKRTAMLAHGCTLLLVHAAKGGDLVVTNPAAGMTLAETQAAVDEIVAKVRA